MNEKKIDPIDVEFDLEEELKSFEDYPEIIYIDEEDEEGSRPLSEQEIINALEERIKYYDSLKKDDLLELDNIEHLYRTVRLLCVILSVELNKTLHDDEDNPNYIL